MKRKTLIKILLIIVLLLLFYSNPSEAFTTTIDDVQYNIADNELFTKYHYLIYVFDTEKDKDCSHEHHYLFRATIFDCPIDEPLDIIFDQKLSGKHTISAKRNGIDVKLCQINLYLDNHSNTSYNTWTSFLGFDYYSFSLSNTENGITTYHQPKEVVCGLSTDIKDKNGEVFFKLPQNSTFIQIVEGINLKSMTENLLGAMKVILPVLVGLIALYIGSRLLFASLRKS